MESETGSITWGTALVRCPECGLEALRNDRKIARARGGGRFALVLVAIAVAVQVLATVGSTRTLGGAGGGASGGAGGGTSRALPWTPPQMMFAPRSIGSGDLDRLAAGGGDGVLSRAAIGLAPVRTPDRPGKSRLLFAFTAPSGYAGDAITFGWPVWWCSDQVIVQANDVYSGLRPRSAVPAAGPGYSDLAWMGEAYLRTQGFYSSALFWRYQWVSPAAVGTSIAIVVASWYAGRLAPALGGLPSLGLWRLVRRGPFLFSALAGVTILAGTILGLDRRTPLEADLSKLPPTRPTIVLDAQGAVSAYAVDPYLRFTALDSGTVSLLHADAAGDSAVARSILDALGGVRPAGALCLGFEEETEESMRVTSIGWPWPLVWAIEASRVWRREDVSPRAAVYPAGPFRVFCQDSQLIFRAGSAAPHAETFGISIPLTHAALNLFCLWMVWMIGRGIAWLWNQRKGVRRRRNGQCVNCGYSLEGLGAMT